MFKRHPLSTRPIAGATNNKTNRIAGGIISATLSLSLCGILPAAVQATETDAYENWFQAASETFSDQSTQNATLSEDVTLDPTDKLDLRDKGVVTPVKLQNPWGNCWGFAIIAACETSILSESGTTYESSGLDLSELQLAASVYKLGGVPASVSTTQAGEGYQNTSIDPNAGYFTGGFQTYGTSMFSAGIGPVSEATAPYQNKGVIGGTSTDAIIICTITYKEIDESTGTNKLDVQYLTENEIAELEKNPDVLSVEKTYYAGNYETLDGSGTVYTDWSVSDDVYNSSDYRLENGNSLPDTRILDENGKCVGTNLSSVKTIQSEFQKGRAISVAFCADQSTPNEQGQAKYINKNTWAHYTYETQYPTHAVTIVGYDNSYSKTNFGGGETAKQPEGDGAWLVKNSWGAETESFPNKMNWGEVNSEGKSTGYFWISYYDKSICYFESFDFDVDATADDDSQSYIDQYDFLPESEHVAKSSTEPVSSANIFTASENIAISALSSTTCKPNSTVKYEVYLLDDEAQTPTDPGHSTLVGTFEDTYEFAGYHRETIKDSNSWIPVRSGQRYAVVTTEYCNDDGKYYQGVATQLAKHTEQEIWKYEEDMMVQTNQKYWDILYPALFMSYACEIDKDTGQKKYTEEEAKEKAEEDTKNMLDPNNPDSTWGKKVEKEVADKVDVYKKAYFVSVVNEGESWSGSTKGTTEQTVWSDWKTNVKEAVEAASTTPIVADNAQIKALAKPTDWASVENLNELKAAINSAKALLTNSKISADGSDVLDTETWLTQAQYDALTAAIADAEATLALAGDDYETTLVNTTPTSDTVKSATESVAFTAQYGTKASTKPSSDDASKQASTKSPMAKTGDDTALEFFAFTTLIAASAATTITLYRRKKET
ncbi:MAG: lectin like domain-containing protein, partial [Phoenicibacter congonensis]|nr:lectin like domain-containing protein [Phoenicibacter congonensis]